MTDLSWMKKFLIALAVFVVLLAAAYFPKINQSSFLQDDWNTLFVTENRSPGEMIFHFSIDRPLRGYFGLLEYKMLGTNMAGYQASAFLWRLVDTLALYLALSLVWPKKWKANLLITALVLVYPGFHEQPHAFDYQAHLFSRMCLSISILLSLVPFYARGNLQKVLSIAGALLLAQVSYGLMDVYIGMEALRVGLIAVVYLHRRNTLRWWKVMVYSLVYLVGAGAFTYWRLFIFESRRSSVDAGSMLAEYGSFSVKLLENGRAMLVNLYRLVVSAYYKPLLVFGKYVDMADLLIGIVIALLSAGVVITMLHSKKLDDEISTGMDDADRHYPITLIVVGVVGSIGALAPVIFGGREITYIITGDRFSYPGSISACIFIIGLIWLIKRRGVRLGLAAVLVFLSVLTQFTNNTVFAKNGDQTRDVWWQMSWRAPQLEPQTLLSGNIYLGMLDEDYTMWGPANIIYYPESRDITITAEVLDENTQKMFASQGVFIAERRGIAYTRDFGNLLLISKAENACLHIIDGLHPEYSQNDVKVIREVGKLSQLERIEVESAFNPQPRTDIFGPEPARDWCYYYQKAQLERQKRDWQTAANYGEEALAAGYVPQDAMEWLVILQAYAYNGNDNYGVALRSVLADDYASGQVCQVFSSYTDEMAKTEFSYAHEQLLKDVCGAEK